MFWNFVLSFTFDENVFVLVSMSSHLFPESPLPTLNLGILLDFVVTLYTGRCTNGTRGWLGSVPGF